METRGVSSNLSSVCVYGENGCTRVAGTAPCMDLPSPPAESSSSSSSAACECQNGTRHSRVAICMTGALRSFTEQPVYSSIAANLLHPLRCADLFAVISLLDSGVLTNVKAANGSWVQRQGRMHTTAEAAHAALAALRPRVVAIWADSVDRAMSNATCDVRLTPRGFLADQGTSAALSQAASWAQCHRAIEMVEATRGVKYTHVIRTRPDLRWEAPHPTVCQLEGARIRHSSWQLLAAGPANDVLGRGHIDHHFVTSRRMADTLLGLYDAYYEACDVVGCSGSSGASKNLLACPPALEVWLWQACTASAVHRYACQRWDFKYRLTRAPPVCSQCARFSVNCKCNTSL